MPKIRNLTIGSNRFTSPQFLFKSHRHRVQRGFDSLPSERKDQVLEYYSTNIRGVIREWSAGRTSSTISGPNLFGTTQSNAFSVMFRDSEGAVPFLASVRNKAYDKFKEAATGESAQLGVLLAERKEAFGMIANRVLGLRSSYRSLRRGDFKGALKKLSVDPKRKHRNKRRAAAHEVSGLWLEYWFGWSPTVQDIYSGCEVLTQDLPVGRYSGTSGSRFDIFSEDKDTQPNWDTRERGLYLCKTGATVKLVNPDLFLMSQLGLINPVSIAWEVVPFSFVVDWFTKLGSVIDATTDWVGLELSDPYRTYLVPNYSMYHRNEVAAEWRKGFYFGTEYNGTLMARHRGLQKPTVLVPKLLNFGTSKTRAATAVSLLTALFIEK